MQGKCVCSSPFPEEDAASGWIGDQCDQGDADLLQRSTMPLSH